MKLKKFIRHIDFCSDTILYVEDEKVWEGSTPSLHAAAEKKEERERYLEECHRDEDLKAISEFRRALPYMNYHLDTCVDYEACGATHAKNSHGVDMCTYHINIKKEK